MANLIKRIFSKIDKIRFEHMLPDERAEYLRGKVYHMGKNVKIYTTAIGTEPYLISIHDNVNVASSVAFITHDVSCYNITRYLNYDGILDKVGAIELWDNCMIGAHAILMPGCSVGKNSIIAAGSIVTKHVPDNEVWGGNPAKFIMTVDEYAKKLKTNSENYSWMQNGAFIIKENSTELIKARQNYFFKKE